MKKVFLIIGYYLQKIKKKKTKRGRSDFIY